MVERLVGHSVQVAWNLVGDVDPESLAQYATRMGMDALLGPAAGTDDLDVALGAVPQKRFGSPEDIAHAVLYLSSDESGFVHGASLAVDGGMTAA